MSIVQSGDMARELDRLRSELAKAAEDSRRLDWMVEHRAEASWLSEGHAMVSYRPGPEGYTMSRKYGSTLRDAIDAGMCATGDLP